MPHPPTPTISKSKFLSGLQCPLLLWTQYNDRALVPPPPPATQYVFDMGHTVGDLAKLLFPDGIEVRADGGTVTGDLTHVEARPDLEATAAATRALLPLRRPIFEASFLSDEPTGRRYVRADVLAPTAGPASAAGDEAWDLFEVKSATRVKEINLWDVAFQAGALEGTGLRLARLNLVHINTSYVRQGALEPDRLFARADVTAEVRERMPEVRALFARQAATIGGERPAIPIGSHCTDPYDCALLPVCWRDLPEHHATTMVRAGRRAYTWMQRGWTSITDVPDRELGGTQLVQKQAVATGRPRVEPAAVRRLLAQLEYPLWHLDFESLNPAVPLFDGTRPFEQVPFQYSLHVQESPGASPRHLEFLATTNADPRPALLEALRAIGPHGTVLAFNATFESQVLAALGRDFPRYRDLTDDLIGRLRDLAEPFQSFAVYHPRQRGSYSLKAVLPAWTGHGYDDLPIADGRAAGRAWQRAVYATDLTPADRAALFDALRAYCGRDTGAMVELLEVLRKLA